LKLGIDPDQPDTNAVLLDGKGHLRSDSALAVLSALPHWRWTRIFHSVPKPLRDRFYSMIARNRYKLLGTLAACDLGGRDYADRVIN
jgi:predicted DCC family thiol-disulfide oxidoreductase YuxK